MDQITFETHVKPLAFRQCPHCRSWYHFYLLEGSGLRDSRIDAVNSKARAYHLLGLIREHLLDPMSDMDYSRWYEMITASTLDEVNPDKEIEEQQTREHAGLWVVGQIKEVFLFLPGAEKFTRKTKKRQLIC